MKLTDEIENDSRLGQEASKCSGGDAKAPGRRLIKVDSSLMNEDSDDDEEPEEEPATDGNPWQRTGSLVLSEAEIQHYCDTTLECRPAPQSQTQSQCCIL